MATNLKIKGNFFALSDSDTGSEFFRIPKCETSFIYTIESSVDYFVFESLNSLRRDSEKVDFTDINEVTKDGVVVSISDVDSLDTFLSENLGGCGFDGSEPVKQVLRFKRIETISQTQTTPVDYFSFVQGGTEILPSITLEEPSTIEVTWSTICENSATNNRVGFNLKSGASDVFTNNYIKESKDNNDILYLSQQTTIALGAGETIFECEYFQQGGGNANCFEMYLKLEEI